VSIQRVPSVPFAQIANEALRDRRLSFKARGILGLVLSHSGEWTASAKWIESQSDIDGRAAVQAALNELTKYGYRSVHREQINGDIRTVVVWRHAPEMSISRPTENLTVRKPDGQKTRRSIEHNPSEQQRTEHNERKNEHLPDPFDSTDQTAGMNVSRETALVPADGLTDVAVVVGPTVPSSGTRGTGDADFEAFWSVYPRHVARRAAEKAWRAAVRRASPGAVLDGAVRYANDPNRDIQFTKHATTWLNSDCWTDEALPPQRPTGPMTALERKRQAQRETLLTFTDDMKGIES
jgi:hypothetical protein